MPSPAALEAGRASIRLGLDSQGVSEGLDRLQIKLKQFGQRLEQIGRQAIIAGSAITGAFAFTVKKASDAEEALNAFSVVFGDLERSATSFADTLAKQIGRSSLTIKKGLTDFQSFFTGLGIGADEALELSKRMQTLSFDFASLRNLSDDEAMQRFISALSGSSEVLAKFGIDTKVAALEQEALRLGINKQFKDMSELEKTILRASVITQRLSKAEGDAARTKDSLANRTKSLKDQLDDTATVIGNALRPEATKLVVVITRAVRVVELLVLGNSKLVKIAAIAGVSLLTLGAASIVLGKAMVFLSLSISNVRKALTFLSKHPYLVAATLATILTLQLTGAFGKLHDAINRAIGDTSEHDEEVRKLSTDFAKLAEEAGKAGDAIDDANKVTAALDRASSASSRSAALFDTRLSTQILGQGKFGRVEDQQLRVQRQIEQNTRPRPVAIPVI